jgi:hypothetical protein
MAVTTTPVNTLGAALTTNTLTLPPLSDTTLCYFVNLTWYNKDDGTSIFNRTIANQPFNELHGLEINLGAPFQWATSTNAIIATAQGPSAFYCNANTSQNDPGAGGNNYHRIFSMGGGFQCTPPDRTQPTVLRMNSGTVCTSVNTNWGGWSILVLTVPLAALPPAT